jgi:hypothetical protein
VTATIEDEAYAADLLDAVAADTVFVISLTARPPTLERRIRAREPAGWSGLDDLVAASARLSRTMPGALPADLTLDTDELDVAECVRRMRAALALV